MRSARATNPAMLAEMERGSATEMKTARMKKEEGKKKTKARARMRFGVELDRLKRGA
jgi:hypothetical protein